MSGFALTIGCNASYKHKNLHDKIKKNKYFEESIQKNMPNYCLSKYKRTQKKDNNYIDDNDISIYCVGNVAFNNKMGKDALTSLKMALKIDNLKKIVSFLDGHFVLIIINHDKKKINIITDHLGIIHIYKHFDGKRIYLTTSSIALSSSINVSLDVNSVIQFLRCDSICDYDTIYREIKLLEPGCIYQYDIQNDTAKESKEFYWKTPTIIDEKMKFEDATELWKNALREACSKVPKKNTICDLTGGFDTRSLLAAFVHDNNCKLEEFSTFTFGPEFSDEVKTAKDISNSLQLPIMHAQLPNEWEEKYYENLMESMLLTDGEENTCKYTPIMYANKKKSEKYEYSVNGLGGPIVKSFNWIQEFDIRKKPANLKRFIYMRSLKSEFNNNIFNQIWRDNLLNIDNTLTEKYLSTLQDMDLNTTFNTLQLDNIDFRQRERRWGGRTISSSNRIINVISPLYFKKCMEVGMVIPPRYKKNKRLLRNVISNLHTGLAKEKMLNGAPCEVISYKNFYKFTPLLTALLKKSARVGLKKFFDKDIFIAQPIDYHRCKWYEKIFSKKQNSILSDLENWSTIPLYDLGKLKEFVECAKAPNFKHYTQLEKMITLELRIRKDQVKKFD